MNAPAESLRLADFDQPSTLIYGIGNVGRQDDGLGWAFIDWLEDQGLCPQAELMRHYQLQLEDAELISHKERVLFVDASIEADLDTFALRRVEPRLDYSFTSHAISIASIVATCRTCFGRTPEVYVLAIKGYEWELQVGLSAPALLNLQAAQHHLHPICAAESA